MATLSKEYLERTYRQAVLEYRTAIDDNAKHQAMSVMAKTERSAAELYGFDYADKLHGMISN